MKMIAKYIILLTLLSGTSFASSYSDQKHKVELISGYEQIAADSALYLGLKYDFQKDWKTYWKAPGVVGYPLKIDFSKSSNIKSIKVLWPAPEEFTTYGLKSYGYSGSVILPLLVTVSDPGQPIKANIEFDYLVCDPENCIPEKHRLVLDVPSGSENVRSNHFLDIESFLGKVPLFDTGVGMTFERAEIDESPEKYNIIFVSAYNSNGFKDPELFIGSPSSSYVESPEISLSEDRKRATITAKVYLTEQKLEKPTESWINTNILFVLKDGDHSIESQRFLTSPEAGFFSLLTILLFALIGGFILNFMPCVLPVITIKILSILEHGGASEASVRKNFLLTSLGILVAFIAIATSVYIMKNLGLSIGWGVQFQEPYFLVAISLIVGFFAYNLLGLFEILLSSKLSTAMVKAESVEAPYQFFLSGVFVTILATPCTAPFLGTALSFALSRGTVEIYLVFTTMGLGLALPFLLIALEPKFEARLPKPGKWMLTLKKSLSILLFATLVWLLWTLSALKGTQASIVIGVFIALIGLALFIRQKVAKSGLLTALIGLLVIASLATPYFYENNTLSKDLTNSIMQKFDESKISGLVKDGKIVFVDVTADWCITCKANENFVLNTAEVTKLLSQDNVVAMYADWTKGDPEITTFLKRYGKYGVPFYIVFGPSLPDGLPLSEILTIDIVKSALKQAESQEN